MLRETVLAGASANGGSISIKGASAGLVTVEVRELVSGTTTADVELIFSQHGKVISTTMPDDQPAGGVGVHVKFEERSDALSSCKAKKPMGTSYASPSFRPKKPS
ncbi:hypothetical protein BOTBODRAFT_437742 [Botryobasidium botryosum FD-172 SS1]|uniref:RRM domain-containing protein n=1 Tax=Botryobasidium botryosum (strain FD-172 SS1) TaxID=930990 RepID=A0A067MUW4_BOTB1|nr:hypothetical protein BOTBODRAFT_437742 [Botryobasidium botryosum FD-172 SS1]